MRIFSSSRALPWYPVAFAALALSWSPAQAQQETSSTEAISAEMTDLNFLGSERQSPLDSYPEGWTQQGGQADYEFADGVLTGTSVAGTPNSFMTTDESYANFVLRYEYRVNPDLNSGVQIRSSIQKNGRFGGPQIEIDHQRGATPYFTAGIFGEALSMGWISPSGEDSDFSEQGERLLDLEGWNEVIVLALGTRIVTFLNGEERVDFTDESSQLPFEGQIGLQVHGVGPKNAGKEVAWRNLELVPLDDEANPELIDELVETLGLKAD